MKGENGQGTMSDLDDILAKAAGRPHALSRGERAALLSLEEPSEIERLFKAAYDLKVKYCGKTVAMRGIIEAGNVCAKDCLYCGIRKSNARLERYSLDADEIVRLAEFDAERGYASLVIQSGEIESDAHTRFIEDVLRRIAPLNLGVTLSLGEQTEDVYRRWREAGAARYLLRVETSNRRLYSRLHPEGHSFDRRVECLRALRRCGYQVGTGVMCALPGQTAEDLADDIGFFAEIDADMIGMGPFIPHPDTPLWQYRDQIPSANQRMELTLKMIATLRLMMPEINMVAATANQTVDPQGREKAIAVGANVIMPNLTPNEFRENYLIYPDKACVSDKPDQCQTCLDVRLAAIGHKVLYNAWGDSVAFTKKKGAN